MAPATQTPHDALAKLQVRNDTDADAQIRDGYPVSVAMHVQDVLDLTDTQMAEILGRSRRTYTRYRNEDKILGLPESERLFRYVRLLAKAEEIFGARDKAAWWMRESNATLDGRTPIDVALTAPGAVVVEELLAGIEHGFPL
jgi:putative toxin-antitoxin system antitoxin component (TIGR02293 family)